MDNWSLLDEYDVMGAWPNEQRKNVESLKWQERKEALESLSSLIEKNPRLCTTSMTLYGEVMDNLKKIVQKDSNVNVVLAALAVIRGLALGLRQKFACYVSMILPHVLEKSKDKKQSVRDAVGAALDAISATCDSDRLCSPLVEQLKKPSPQTKQCMASFLYRYFKTLDAPPMPFFKEVLPLLVKLASDPDKTVREEVCCTLGSAKRLLGDAITVYLQPISKEQAKLDRIAEFHEKATSEWKEEQSLRGVCNGVEMGGEGGGASGAAEGMAEGQSSAAAAVEIDPWTLKEPLDLVKQMPKNWNELISSKKWQERKEAMDSLLALLESEPRLETTPELCELIPTLIKILEKDVNINVTSLVAKSLCGMSKGMREDFSKFVPKVMSVSFDKMKEKKAVLRNELVALTDAAATTTCPLIYMDAVHAGLASKNPQSRAQTAAFVCRLLARHDRGTMPVEAVKQLAPVVIKTSSDADVEVRDASLRVAAAVWKSLGEDGCQMLFRDILEDKMKKEKISPMVEELRKEFGESASLEMRRLHARMAPLAGGDAKMPSKPVAKSSGAPRPPSAVRPSGTAVRVPVRPAVAPLKTGASRVASRPTTTSSAPRPTPRPSASRPTTAPARPPVTVPPKVSRTAVAPRAVAPSTTRPTAPRPNVVRASPGVVRSRESVKPAVAAASIPRSRSNSLRRPTTSRPVTPSRPTVNVVRRPTAEPVPSRQPAPRGMVAPSSRTTPIKVAGAAATTNGGMAKTGIPSTFKSGIRPPSARPSGLPMPRPPSGSASSRPRPPSATSSAHSSRAPSPGL